MIRLEDRQIAIELIDEARNHGARLRCCCQVVGITERTYRRWQQTSYDRRIDRINPEIAVQRRLTQEEETAIIDVCTEERFASYPASQIVPALADEGVYLASESSVYRILKRHKMNARRGRAQRRNKPAKPKAYTATAPGQVYTWDITFLPSTIIGVFFKLYLVIDLYSRKIVGWEVHDRESSDLAKALIYRTQLREQVDPNQLTVHSDNGSPMRGVTLRAMFEALGVTASYSRPGVSNDNPFSESLFRTLKYCPNYPEKPFSSIDAAREWVMEFVTWYNHQHRHSSLKFVTPHERHTFQDVKIRKERKLLYEAAKAKNPSRWSRDTRNWDISHEVVLNPDKELVKCA